MTSTCQLSRNGSSKTLEEPFVKVEILRRDCPSRSPHFNPLRPCGRRLLVIRIHGFHHIFQSTPPVWAETSSAKFSRLHLPKFQSTPPVWAETLSERANILTLRISIHSARVGGDLIEKVVSVAVGKFQSTPPVWAETSEYRSLDQLQLRISIHSARVGGDTPTPLFCGALYGFQSTPPVWAETSCKGS